MRLDSLVLALEPRLADETKRFYSALIGAEAKETSPDRLLFSFPDSPQSANLEFLLTAEPPASAQDGVQDSYWKIGLSLADVCVARERLVAGGVDVSTPAQFLDIGFMAHLKDPAGNVIELLQHRFEANHEALGEAGEGRPLRQPVWVGQITLRVNGTAQRAVSFYRDQVGMAYVSHQPVTGKGFSLHFFAAEREPRPDDTDLQAVANREWLWQRPYTTLELVSYSDPARRFSPSLGRFRLLRIGVDKLNEHGHPSIASHNFPLSDFKQQIETKDPDDHLVELYHIR